MVHIQGIRGSQDGVRSTSLRFLLKSRLVLPRTKPTPKDRMAPAVGTGDTGEGIGIDPASQKVEGPPKATPVSQENAFIIITEPGNFSLEQLKEQTTPL